MAQQHLQPVHGLDVVRIHVQAAGRQVAHGRQVAAEVRREALHPYARPQRLQRAHRARKVLRACKQQPQRIAAAPH